MANQAKYRVLPRNEFDDKGNVKPFKPDKRKDSDWKLGGVKGKFADIEKDHWVLLKLRQNKKGTVFVADIVVVLGMEDGSPPAAKSKK